MGAKPGGGRRALHCTAQPFSLISRKAPISMELWGGSQIRMDRGARTKRGSGGDQSPTSGVGGGRGLTEVIPEQEGLGRLDT